MFFYLRFRASSFAIPFENYFIKADYVYLKYAEIKNLGLRFVYAQVPDVELAVDPDAPAA